MEIQKFEYLEYLEKSFLDEIKNIYNYLKAIIW